MKKSSKASRKLLEEAVKDLEIGCYNKAASASYFAARILAEEILKTLKEPIPRRDDKLINSIRNKGLINEAIILGILYQYRKRADHQASIEREEAEIAVRKSIEIIESMEKYLGKIAEKHGNK